MNKRNDRLDEALDASLARNFQVPDDPAAKLQHLLAPERAETSDDDEPAPALPELSPQLARAAQYLLDRAGIRDVTVKPTQGFLSDHYNPVTVSATVTV